LTDRDLAELPKLEWLVEGLFPAGSFAVLYGPSGVGKSFVALDLAHVLADGLAWQGRRTRQGPVLYIAAEGTAGLRLRVEAWKQKVGRRRTRVRYVPEAVQLHQADHVDALIEQIQQFPEPPVLIIFDTLARCFVGAEESSSKDMGQLVASVDRVRAATGAAVLMVHHTGKKAYAAERGSSALGAAADLRMSLSARGDRLILRCEKMKDGAAPFAPIAMRLRPVPLADGESCVVESTEAAADDCDTLNEKAQGLLQALQNFGRPAGPSEWRERSGLPHRTFYRVVEQLLQSGRVERSGSHYGLTGASAKPVPRECHGTDPTASANSATTLKGGTLARRAPRSFPFGPSDAHDDPDEAAMLH
jgi:KaiC/GvpD/RAD55 family RecA-like ATPase